MEVVFLCDKAAMRRDKLKGTLHKRLNAGIIISLWNLKVNCQVHKYLKCLAVAEGENLEQYRPLSYTQCAQNTCYTATVVTVKITLSSIWV